MKNASGAEYAASKYSEHVVREETTLLEFLMKNAGRTLSTKVILQRVWNVDSLPPSKIVESRICSLRRKLSQNGEPDMISTIRGFGYVLK